MVTEIKTSELEIARGLITPTNVRQLISRLKDNATSSAKGEKTQGVLKTTVAVTFVDGSHLGDADANSSWNDALIAKKLLRSIHLQLVNTYNDGAASSLTIELEHKWGMSLELDRVTVSGNQSDSAWINETVKAIDLFANAPTEGLLWHYTMWDGLRGIVENNEIWSSSAAYLNDTQEIKRALEIIKPIAEASGHRQVSDTFSEPAFEFAAQRWYLTSFSAAPDDLGQWRGYTESHSRFAIGFDRARLSEVATSWDWTLVPCKYDLAEQQALVQPILASLDTARKNAAAEAAHNRDRTLPLPDDAIRGGRAYSILQSKAVQDIFGAACQMKDPCFSDEAEERLAKQIDWEGNLLLTGSHQTKYGFRQKGSLVIPYLKMPLRDRDVEKQAAHPIVEIIIGPSTEEHKALNVQTVKKLMLAHKFANIRVLPSLIPFRTY
jgi:hypothetical protein